MKRQAEPPEPPAAARSTGSATWTDTLACRLIRRAAHRAPPALSERLEEEWLADLAARRGPVARLLFAGGCAWAAGTIALEFGAPVRVAATATASRAVAVGERPRPPAGAPRLLCFLAIVAVHVLLIYALAHSLRPPSLLPMLPPALRPFFIDTFQPPVTLPNLSAPRLTGPIVRVPLPVVHFDAAPDSGGALTASVTSAQMPPSTAQPAHSVHRVVGGPGAGFPNTAEFYSLTARRLGEEGAATVRVCVDDAGRLTSPPMLAQSSGSAALDASALRLARAGSGRYRATTEDGRPVSSCFAFRVRFQMRG
jgi:TonB family protein